MRHEDPGAGEGLAEIAKDRLFVGAVARNLGLLLGRLGVREVPRVRAAPDDGPRRPAFQQAPPMDPKKNGLHPRRMDSGSCVFVFWYSGCPSSLDLFFKAPTFDLPHQASRNALRASSLDFGVEGWS